MADVPSDNTVGGQGGVPKQIEDLKTGPTVRRGKSPSERIERVEERLDAHDIVLAKVSTQMDGQDDILGIIKGSVERLEQRSDVVFTGRMAVHTATQTAAVAVQAATQTATIADAADKKKQRRERITQVIKGVVGGGLGLEIIHRLFL